MAVDPGGLSILAAALLGLVLGSFSNVVAGRVPLRRSVVRPRSWCPGCGAEVSARENVPLASYALLRGRCRGCGTRISTRYPLVEATTGLLFGLAAHRFGAGVQLLWALALVCALVCLAVTDLEHRLLPNAIVGPAAVVGLLLSTAADPGGWWVYPVCAAVVGGGLFAVSALYPGKMGMGDVKMGGMLGAFLGPYAALAVFLGAAGGAVVGGALLASGRIRRGSALPFGTFMAFGGLVALFAGPEIVGAYLGLFGGA